MRRFELHRYVDETGISGTGTVAQGIEFDNGKIAMQWLTSNPSMVILDCVLDLERIHGHNGKTLVVWVDA